MIKNFLGRMIDAFVRGLAYICEKIGPPLTESDDPFDSVCFVMSTLTSLIKSLSFGVILWCINAPWWLIILITQYFTISIFLSALKDTRRYHSGETEAFEDPNEEETEAP